MVIAYYIVGAVVAAWVSTGKSHLDLTMSLLLLPSLFLAHFCYKAMAAKNRSDTGSSPIRVCLACQKKLSLFRRLDRQRFCCDEHETMYLTELDQLAIERLQNARVAATATTTQPSLERLTTSLEIKLQREALRSDQQDFCRDGDLNSGSCELVLATNI